MTNCIRTAYAALQNVLAEGENLIQKVLLVVTGHEVVMYLDEIGGDNDYGKKGGDIALRVTSQQDQILAVHSEMMGLSRDIHQLNTALEAHQVQQRRDFEMVQSNIQIILVQPGVRRANNTTNNESKNRGTGATPTVCTLSLFPRNL